MIIKGGTRAGGADLGVHLNRTDTNERVRLLELRGVAGVNLDQALREMEAFGAGTRCKSPLYHANIDPRAGERLTPEQWGRAVDALEAKLGFTGQPRALVQHVKEGREHVHVVWSRIDLERNRAIPDSHNYRKHEEVARALEREFGHERVQGAHVEREGKERPARTPSHAEMQQAERTGLDPKAIKAEITALWRQTDSGKAFAGALAEAGYILARGDKRDFIVIDQAGESHSLARRIDGVKAADMRARLSDIDQATLPDARGARAEQAQKALEGAQKAEEARRAAEAAQKAAEAAERQRAADEADRTRWRSMPLSALQWEVNTLLPDREAAKAGALMADPAYREAEKVAETARAGEAKARLDLLEATETVRNLNQKAEGYQGRQGPAQQPRATLRSNGSEGRWGAIRGLFSRLGGLMFWRQDKEVSENPESKRIQTQIAEWTELAAERQGVLDRAEKLHTEARLTVGTLYSRIAGQVDEALAPEYRRYSAAQSVLDERIEEDRRRAAEAEAERRAEEIRRRVDAEIEREKREGIGWQVSVQDGVVTTWWSDGKSPQEDETKEATKDELQEREAQANREKDRGFDMMD
ncbi:MAG: relaxase/mobilization nuclease domain-containing protein [Acidiphilium sp.]|nr:relaxase/mobilization nuclease domain-containing protein [Acidiphilium sp.]